MIRTQYIIKDQKGFTPDHKFIRGMAPYYFTHFTDKMEALKTALKILEDKSITSDRLYIEEQEQSIDSEGRVRNVIQKYTIWSDAFHGIEFLKDMIERGM